jgi:hypothetical protein
MNWLRAKKQLVSALFWLKTALVVSAGGGATAAAALYSDPTNYNFSGGLKKLAIAFAIGGGVAFVHWLVPAPKSNTPQPPSA